MSAALKDEEIVEKILLTNNLKKLSVEKVTKKNPVNGRIIFLFIQNGSRYIDKFILPPEIGQLDALEELHLNNCNIYDLPEEIGDLKGLTRLHIERNKIEELPEAIGLLCNLRFLSLLGNNICKLPSDFYKISRLQYLNLERNSLREFPLEICSLKDLEYVRLADNYIETIPESIFQLTKLRSLDLYRNRLYPKKLSQETLNFLKPLIGDTCLDRQKPEISDDPYSLEGQGIGGEYNQRKPDYSVIESDESVIEKYTQHVTRQLGGVCRIWLCKVSEKKKIMILYGRADRGPYDRWSYLLTLGLSRSLGAEECNICGNFELLF